MSSIEEQLAACRQAQIDLRNQERSLVDQARQEKVSWSRIGRALGISHQAAHRMYGSQRPNLEDLPLSDPLFDPLFSHKPE